MPRREGHLVVDPGTVEDGQRGDRGHVGERHLSYVHHGLEYVVVDVTEVLMHPGPGIQLA